MKGSTNSNGMAIPSANTSVTNSPSYILIGANTYLCWGYIEMPFQSGTEKIVTVYLPVTARNSNEYFPVVTMASNPSYWSVVALCAPAGDRGTTTFKIRSWINVSDSISGSVLAFWQTVIRTA